MFHHSEERKRSFGFFMIFRLLLSLIIFAVLGLGVYQAFVYFSGTDPTRVDPKAAVISFLTSEGLNSFSQELLGVSIPQELIREKLALVGLKEEMGSVIGENTDILPSEPEEFNPERNLFLRFALVADSHNDNQSLAQALDQAKTLGSKFVIGLGDYSDVGTVEELKKAKKVFEGSGLPYYLTAGDHDLWDARDKGFAAVDRFNEVFGSPYQSFGDSDIRFVLLFNGDNYSGVDAFQMNWLEDELRRVKATNPRLILAFMHEPLNHPSSDRVMGKSNEKLREQAEYLSGLLAENGVKGVFFGDIHFFTQYKDSKFGLPMFTVGALTSTRNTQKSRFALVDVFEDGTYNIQDSEIP